MHTDWHESKAIPGKQVIAFLDGARGVVLAMDEYDNANAENSVKTLKKAIRFAWQCGGIRQVLTGTAAGFRQSLTGN